MTSELEEQLLLASNERQLDEAELFELVGELDAEARARISRSRDNILRAMKTGSAVN